MGRRKGISVFSHSWFDLIHLECWGCSSSLFPIRHMQTLLWFLFFCTHLTWVRRGRRLFPHTLLFCCLCFATLMQWHRCASATALSPAPPHPPPPQYKCGYWRRGHWPSAELGVGCGGGGDNSVRIGGLVVHAASWCMRARCASAASHLAPSQQTVRFISILSRTSTARYNQMDRNNALLQHVFCTKLYLIWLCQITVKKNLWIDSTGLKIGCIYTHSCNCCHE